MKALVIDSNGENIKGISLCLKLRWPECIALPASIEGDILELIEEEMPDLVFLDMSKFQTETLDLLNRIRAFCNVPIIVLTEEENDMVKVSALEIGADDYVYKSFNPIELLAKISALLRRVRGISFNRDIEPVTMGNMSLDFTTREVRINSERIQFTPIEFELLTKLVKNEGNVCTHAALLETVWGRDYYENTGFVKKYIYRLRSKLRDDAQNPKILLSERGIGYKFVKPI